MDFHEFCGLLWTSMECPWTVCPWKIHGPVDFLLKSPWTLVIIVDFVWTSCGLFVDFLWTKITIFAVGFCQKKKSIGSPQKVHKSPWTLKSPWSPWSPYGIGGGV